MPSRENIRIIIDETANYGLRTQHSFGPYDFPFTLNPSTGCSYGCTYCSGPIVLHNLKDKSFFERVRIKRNLPELVRRDIWNYAGLPSHLKRVQINETSEYYLPELIWHFKNHWQDDVLRQILNIFADAWARGNKWMLHILTKSPLITHHLNELSAMREMVQVEISLPAYSDADARKVEFATPSVKERFMLIKKLSDLKLFVRVMGMPHMGDAIDLERLLFSAIDLGASAVMNKGLNYYRSWDELNKFESFEEFLSAKLKVMRFPLNAVNPNFVVKSGEPWMDNRRLQTVVVPMPILDSHGHAKAIHWPNRPLVDHPMTVIDMGYADCNGEDWGYLM